MHEVIVLQHIACESLGTIEPSLTHAGIHARYVRAYAGETVPPRLDDAHGLILMGGPMSVDDQSRYPFLRDELQLLESALRLDRPILGICLGSQLLAAALGADVRRGAQKEIGWHTVTLSEPAADDVLWKDMSGTLTPLHWHGDVFAVPDGAISLAASALTPCQAFRYGDAAYGLLFHMEMTLPIITEMVMTFADELHQEHLEDRHILEGADQYLAAINVTGRLVFDRWAQLLTYVTTTSNT